MLQFIITLIIIALIEQLIEKYWFESKPIEKLTNKENIQKHILKNHI